MLRGANNLKENFNWRWGVPSCKIRGKAEAGWPISREEQINLSLLSFFPQLPLCLPSGSFSPLTATYSSYNRWISKGGEAKKWVATSSPSCLITTRSPKLTLIAVKNNRKLSIPSVTFFYIASHGGICMHCTQPLYRSFLCFPLHSANHSKIRILPIQHDTGAVQCPQPRPARH